ncbi:MAG: FHA domain-containing protein [Caldimonas sp.]
MTVKSWVLQRVHGLAAASGRPDLPARASHAGREPELDSPAGEARARAGLFAEPSLAGVDSLGAYAPLIGAVREEFERFVASHVRLHVVIADRDRFMLTAIGVRSPAGAGARERLQQFMREFRPEQVKRYFAREVIGRLPNAAVIDLSQFAGLSDLEAHGSEAQDEYAELLAALRTEPAPAASPYEISILGRWTESDGRASENEGGGRGRATPATPLAGRRAEFDVDDGGGVRQAVLAAVVPGRRYVVGKGLDCDIRISGTYTSRRHAELWFERGQWFAGDAGSTNGIRVEPAAGSSGRVEVAGGTGMRAGEPRALALTTGSRVVFSARADGPPGDYPWLSLPEIRATAAVAPTPLVPAAIAAPVAAPITEAGIRVVATEPERTAEPPASRSVPSTPRTAILNSRPAEPVFVIGEAGGEVGSEHLVRAAELPITIGRSRGQTLIIDWRHAGVSGQHLGIDRIDGFAAHGIVHGDNGIELGGAHLGPGSRFRWPLGSTMVLGGALPGEPPCTLTLSQRSGD